MPDEFTPKTVEGMRIEANRYANWFASGTQHNEILHGIWACTAEICHRLERIEHAIRNGNGHGEDQDGLLEDCDPEDIGR